MAVLDETQKVNQIAKIPNIHEGKRQNSEEDEKKKDKQGIMPVISCAESRQRTQEINDDLEEATNQSHEGPGPCQAKISQNDTCEGRHIKKTKGAQGCEAPQKNNACTNQAKKSLGEMKTRPL